MYKTTRKGLAVIYRQEILQDITFFTSAPKAQFYDKLFLNLDLTEFPESIAKTDRNGYSKRALLCAFIVMKCECFSYFTDLVDYLNNYSHSTVAGGFPVTSYSTSEMVSPKRSIISSRAALSASIEKSFLFALCYG